MSKYFVLNSAIRERRTSNTDASSMHIPYIRSVVGRKSFSYREPVNWNQIETEIRDSKSINMFKSHLTKELCRDFNHPG